jgi:septum formation protein
VKKKRQENNPVFKIRRIYMLILASKSPRRKEYLEKANLEFIIDTVETEETFNHDLSIEDALIDIARQKVLPVFSKHPTDTILGADTIVVCDNQILGKPKDLNHAREMLKLLSGKVHFVMTAVVIKTKEKETSFVEKTNVYFKKLTEEDIDILITKENVLDKAGSYAIQGVAGSYIEKIEGDYDNVVGLPIKRVLKYIK